MRGFSSGEIGKTLYSKVDLPAYQSGSELIDGFLITPDDAQTMVPGTIYVANTKSDAQVVLKRFRFSVDDTYILEVGALYIRFFRNEAVIVSSGSTPFEVTTTYTAAELSQLSFNPQRDDTIFIFHSAHHPARLVRSDHNSWVLSDLTNTDGPFMLENSSATTLTANVLTGTVTLTASVATFLSGHVNALFRISHDTAEVEVASTFTATGQSSSVFVQKENQWRVIALGTWSATVEVQISFDNITFFTDQTLLTVSTTQQTVSGIAERDLYVRLNCTAFVSGTVTYHIYANSYTHHGVVQITSITSTTVAVGTSRKDLISTGSTTKWSEGAWSTLRGFPKGGFWYQNRLVPFSTTAEPAKRWFSATNDPDSHLIGTLATDAFSQNLDGNETNAIFWVEVETSGLLNFTAGEVVNEIPQDERSAASPTNPLKRVSSVVHRSGFIPPEKAGSSFLMVERGGRAVKELLFSTEEGTVIAPDLTRFIKHMVRVDNADGIVSTAFQARPHPIHWWARSDGVLLAFGYDRNIEFANCTRAGYIGLVESVAVDPKGRYDQVWMSVKYTIGGATKRFICYMDELDIHKPLNDNHFVEAGLKFVGGVGTITNITKASPGVVTLSALPTDSNNTTLANGDNVRITGVVGMTEINDLVYEVTGISGSTLTLLDQSGAVAINTTSFSNYQSGGTLTQVDNTFGGLTHLAGETAYCTINGESFETATVSAGGVKTLTEFVNAVSIGLYKTRETIPLPFERIKSLGKGKHFKGLLMGVFRTAGGQWGPKDNEGVIDTARIKQFDWTKNLDPWAFEDFLYTGLLEIPMSLGVQDRVHIVIQQPGPVPMTLLLIEPDIEVQ